MSAAATGARYIFALTSSAQNNKPLLYSSLRTLTEPHGTSYTAILHPKYYMVADAPCSERRDLGKRGRRKIEIQPITVSISVHGPFQSTMACLRVPLARDFRRCCVFVCTPSNAMMLTCPFSCSTNATGL